MNEIDENYPVSYATRILTELETKNSIIKLELLVVVSSVEHSKNYVYGVKFGVVPDHKALKSVSKSNKGNNTLSSISTRWVDRLLPFDFTVVHAPGRTFGVAKHLSRHPCSFEGNIVKAEELFNILFTIKTAKDFVPVMHPCEANEVKKAKPIRMPKNNK